MNNLIQKYLNSDAIIYGHPFNCSVKNKYKYQIQNDNIFFYHRQVSKNKISKMLQSLSKKSKFQESSQEEDLYDRYYRDNQQNHDQSDDYEDEMYVLQNELDQEVIQKEHYPIINKSWNDLQNISPNQNLKPFKKIDIKKHDYLKVLQEKQQKIKQHKTQSEQEQQNWQTQQQQEQYLQSEKTSVVANLNCNFLQFRQAQFFCNSDRLNSTSQF